MDARIFAMLTWNCVMSVANAARATPRSTAGASGRVAREGSAPTKTIFRMRSGRKPLTVWKWSGRPDSATTSHNRFQYGSQSGVRSDELAMSRPRRTPRLATRWISSMAASMGWFGMEARPA
jgi:hypothetical protein